MSRLERVGVVIQRELAEIMRRRIDSPKIGFISFTHVRLSPDLEVAWAYYSQLGSEEQKAETFSELKRLRKVIRFELGKVLTMKVVPELRFVYDDSLDFLERTKDIHVDQ